MIANKYLLNMKRFAYFMNPMNACQSKYFSNLTDFIPSIISKLFKNNNSKLKIHKISIKVLDNGEVIEGYFIVFPKFIEYSIGQETFIMERIIWAVDIAKKLGVDILGLGAHASILCDKGYTALRKLPIPITSGSSYVSWSVFEAIFRVARTKNIDLSKCCVAIKDATTAIGSLCARKLSSVVPKIILYSNDEIKLMRLKEDIVYLNSSEVTAVSNPHQVENTASIVIKIDAGSYPLIKFKDLNLDITPSLTKIPYSVESRFSIGLPKNIIPVSLAETILLTIEDKMADYSFGDNVNLDKIDEIADIAARHGFEIWLPQTPAL